jgi:hypothetical protein
MRQTHGFWQERTHRTPSPKLPSGDGIPPLGTQTVQLVGFDVEDPNWALVDEVRGELRHVAGGLAAWGPRIAGGEGTWALPQTGRVRPVNGRRPDLRPLLRRVLDLPASRPVAGPRLAAIVGVSLTGRRNPFRSVVGYALLGDDEVCRCIVTRDEFQEADPPALPFADCGGPARWTERLEALDAVRGLRPGDAVVLGAPEVDAPMAARLSASNLGEETNAGGAAGSRRSVGNAADGWTAGARA